MSHASASAESRGAAWLGAAAAKVAGALLSFLLLLALARTMSREAFAHVAVVLAWVAIATAGAGLNLPMTVLRFVTAGLAQGRADLARGMLRFATAVTLVCSLTLAATVAVIAGLDVVSLPGDLARSAVLGGALVVASVALTVGAAFLQALKRVVAAEIFTNVLRTSLMLGAIGVWSWWSGTSLSAPRVVAAYLATTTAALAATIAYARLVSPEALRRASPRYMRREWSRATIGYLGVMIAAAVSERVDMLMIGWLGSTSDIAAYAVAARFAQTTTLTLTAVTAVAAPRLVEHLVDQRAAPAAAACQLIAGTARRMAAVALLALAGFWLVSPWVLPLFGAHFDRSRTPLLILAIGQVVAAMFGPATLVATLAGAARLAVLSLAGGIALNAAGCMLLVPRLGAPGAALSTAFAMLATALTAWALTRGRLGLDASILGDRWRTPARAAL